MGSLNVDSSNLFHGAPTGPRMDVPVWAALIEGHGHTIVVDTGIRDPEWVLETLENPCSQATEETLEGALAAVDVAPERVDTVINTHLHFDHAGHNRLLSFATFFVSEIEWNEARNPASEQQVLYDARDWLAPPLGESSYTLVSGSRYEVADGITLFPTPGHSLGHYSVLVTTDEGVLCVAGDVANHLDSFTTLQPPGLIVSAEAAVDSIRRVATQCDRVFLAHDTSLEPFMTRNYPAVPPTPLADPESKHARA
jgi:glyoxylase-like metal-dependent hydrolase (beta-lactamase superfamily II)